MENKNQNSSNGRDVTTTDLPPPKKDEPDRFNEFALGVKQKYRPEWLDSENALFINKLNFVAKNYEDTYDHTKKMKTKITDHKLQLDDLDIKFRELNQEHTQTRSKLDSMENSLPKMIQQLIDIYTDHQLNPRFSELVSKKEFTEANAVKLDFAVFNEYCKRQSENQMLNNKEFKTDQRLFTIESQLSDVITKEELKFQLKKKANLDQVMSMRDEVHKLQVISMQTQKALEDEVKRVEQEFGKKSSQLSELLTDFSVRLGNMENEMNDDDADDPHKSKPGPLNVGDNEMFGEDDVNIGDADKEKGESKQDSVVDTGGLQNSQIMSKGSSKPSILRKSRDRQKNFKNDPFSSGVNSSKSPENLLKKKNRKGPGGGLDKESKDLIKTLEQRIEELRKTSMQEINRLEAQTERNSQEHKEHIHKIGNAFNVENQETLDQIKVLRNQNFETRSQFKTIVDKVRLLQNQIEDLGKIDPNLEINKIQRKIIREEITAMVTPLKRDMNVDFKQLRKYLEECMNNIKDVQKRQYAETKKLDGVERNLMRTLKNTDNDKNVLNREINRLQHIDRLKVAHASSHIYNPDTGCMLPSLDQAGAQSAAFMTQATANTPQPEMNSNYTSPHKTPFGNGSTISNQDIVTQNELKGICERYNTQPGSRKRIVIARSLDPRNPAIYGDNSGDESAQKRLLGANGTLQTDRPRLGALEASALDRMNVTHHFKNDDSKMSIQAGVVKQYTQMSPGNSPQVHAGSGSIFDSKQKLAHANGRAFEIGTRNMDLPEMNNGQMLPQFSTIQYQPTTRTDFTVDIQTPELPNPMERIKAKGAAKKQDKLEQKKRLEDLLEKSKNNVLDSYHIKSML